MDERAAGGMEHLQAAARELIAAARAFLDVAEDLVDEPGAAAAVIDLVRNRRAADTPTRPGDGAVEHIDVG